MSTTQDSIESGAWIGRQQAFAMIALQCSAAQALALKHIKESRTFEQLGLTWEQFCAQHAGVRRERADAIIRQYDEFGEAYFRLSEIARISPGTYREIAPKMDGNTVEIDGHTFELTPANAVQIRAAIKRMHDSRESAARSARLGPIGLETLQRMQDAVIKEARDLSFYFRPDTGRPELVALANYAIKCWKEASAEFSKYGHQQ